MQFSTAAISAFLLSVGRTSAFSSAPSSAFVSSRASSGASPLVSFVAPHAAGCACASCARLKSMVLASSVETDTDVPAEVEALDGIESEDELHNAERPARKSLKKKASWRKPLNEFNVGDTIQARVKNIASYGAFMDIGAQVDGLLHISQLSTDYVADVNDVLKIDEEIDVRITNIDEKKNQVGLSLLTQAQEDEAKAVAAQPRRPQRTSTRRDDSAVLNQISEKGWDPNQFVDGTVVSTVDFGAFVRVDASQLNSEIEGAMDGLVHISALTAGRADSVTSVVKVDDKVQVRVKDISGGKVSLTMVSPEDEKAKLEKASSGGWGSDRVPLGNKNWKEDLEKLQATMPEFHNRPDVVDRRK